MQLFTLLFLMGVVIDQGFVHPWMKFEEGLQFKAVYLF